MSYKGQVLRGEKWFHLSQRDGWTPDEDKQKDIDVYLESKAKVEAEVKSKGKK